MAASNYIQVTGQTTRLNSQIRSFADELKRVADLGNALKNVLSQSNSDGAAKLATDTGLSAEDAAAVYSLVNSAMTDINASAFVAQLLARCG